MVFNAKISCLSHEERKQRKEINIVDFYEASFVDDSVAFLCLLKYLLFNIKILRLISNCFF